MQDQAGDGVGTQAEQGLHTMRGLSASPQSGPWGQALVVSDTDRRVSLLSWRLGTTAHRQPGSSLLSPLLSVLSPSPAGTLCFCSLSIPSWLFLCGTHVPAPALALCGCSFLYEKLRRNLLITLNKARSVGIGQGTLSFGQMPFVVMSRPGGAGTLTTQCMTTSVYVL